MHCIIHKEWAEAPKILSQNIKEILKSLTQSLFDISAQTVLFVLDQYSHFSLNFPLPDFPQLWTTPPPPLVLNEQ